MKIGLVAAVAVIAVTAAGCNVTNRDVGIAVGAAAGGAVGNSVSGGNRVLGTVAGAFVGGILGGIIGDSLDQLDRQRAAEAEFRALETAPSGRPIRWENPDRPTRTYGTVVAGPAETINERTCRPYTHTIYIDGTPQTARGTACRNRDGTWAPV